MKKKVSWAILILVLLGALSFQSCGTTHDMKKDCGCPNKI